MANLLGDVELDARGMRALAHPVRLAILRQLRENGPNTATGLSPYVGASPSVTSWHLRHLAEHGLVEDAPGDGHGRKRWWQAAGKGFRFTADAEDPEAASLLREAIERSEEGLVDRWMTETRPRLDVEWLQVATRWNTGLVATPDELRHFDRALEELVAPLVNRDPDQIPDGARPVRMLHYLLPAAADEPTEDNP